MGKSAWISLGSNLGDREGLLRMALDELAEDGYPIRAVSSWHETAPMGGPSGQPPFLNGAAEVELAFEKDPERLLLQLVEIERSAGRSRNVRWDARTLDLDILVVEGLFRDVRTLQLPHPRMNWRRFVLAPLAEIAPNLIDPMTGQTIQQLRDDLDRSPLILRLLGPELTTRSVADHLPQAIPPGVNVICDRALGEANRARVENPQLGVVLDLVVRKPGLALYPLLWPEHQTPQAIAHEIGVACRSRLP